MTPEVLVSAIRERLHEIEGMAVAAGQAGRCGCHPGARLTHWAYNGGASVALDNDTGHAVFTAGDSGGCDWLDPRLGAYIALHDPSSVLRRVQADRRVLERHRLVQAHIVANGASTLGVVCAWCDLGGGDDRPDPYAEYPVIFPCPDLVDLAFGLGIDLPEDTDG